MRSVPRTAVQLAALNTKQSINNKVAFCGHPLVLGRLGPFAIRSNLFRRGLFTGHSAISPGMMVLRRAHCLGADNGHYGHSHSVVAPVSLTRAEKGHIERSS